VKRRILDIGKADGSEIDVIQQHLWDVSAVCFVQAALQGGNRRHIASDLPKGIAQPTPQVCSCLWHYVSGASGLVSHCPIGPLSSWLARRDSNDVQGVGDLHGVRDIHDSDHTALVSRSYPK
jgi:hypothetical protein